MRMLIIGGISRSLINFRGTLGKAMLAAMRLPPALIRQNEYIYACEIDI
jgi:hypothetical protein